MLNNTKGVFLDGKFKKYYFIISNSICILWLIAVIITKLLNSDIILNNTIMPYYNGLIFILCIVAMILDEKIRKYPGLLMSYSVSISCFVYINICMMYSTFNIIFLLVYSILIASSVFVFKFIYPKLVVTKHGVKIFNTIYLMIVLSVTMFLGMFFYNRRIL